MSILRMSTQVLAVLGLAMFAGIVLTVARTLVPYWQSLDAEAFPSAFAQFNTLVPAAIAPVLLPTLLALTGSVLFGWQDSRSRPLWLAASACLLSVLALTALYFLPLNSAFAERRVPTNEVQATLGQWARVHWVRVALSLAAPVFGLLAFAQGQSGQDSAPDRTASF